MKNNCQNPKIKKETSFEIRNKILEARKKILFLLTGKSYNIYSKCGNCAKCIPEAELIGSFKKNTTNSFFVCGCGHKVRSFLEVCGKKYRFYSPVIVVDSVKNLNKLSPDEIEYLYPDLYHSAIFHFCTLKNIFSSLGVKYPYNEIGVRNIKPLIGKIPLPSISRITGIPEQNITKLVRGL